jgi:diguanylate cyclase (GGDEF)-like protein/PAS domain S-box-containing protein
VNPVDSDRQVRRLERERAARKQAEELFEHRSKQLYVANLNLKQLTETLQKSEKRLRLITSHAPVGIAEIDTRLRYTYANSHYSHVYGLSPSEVVGKQVHEVIEPRALTYKLPLMRQALAGHPSEHEEIISTPTGEERHFTVAYAPEFNDAGEVIGYVTALSDITERKKIESQLHTMNESLEDEVKSRTALIQQQNDRLRDQHLELLMAKSVFDNSAEAIVVTDPIGEIVLTNPAFTVITGYSADEALGQNMRLLKSQLLTKNFYDELWANLLSEGKWQGEIWNRRKSGELYPEWLTISSVTDESGDILNFVATFSDISSLKQAHEQIEFLAYHDALTGLPNRLLGRERLEQALIFGHQHQEEVGVYFLDIDNFKLINDSHGHSIGDQVLRQVASRLRECLGEADTLCRLAGDEFLLVRTAVKDQATLSELGDSLLKVLGSPISLETGPMDANVSIGIAIYPGDGTDAETLMRNADTALYAAKAGGRRQYQFFNPQMNADLVHNLEVRDSLRLAITHKQFILHYQPKIDLGTREVTGVEALLRWQHPIRGLTYPNYFITIAEESELIVEIGDWVIEEACQQAAEWQSQGLDFGGMAINISALQFKRRDLASLVKHHLHRTGLAPGKLELELTESILIEDFPKAMDAIQILRELGVTVSLDDFGTGHSSLSYLRRFRLDKLKIDRSFIKNIALNNEHKSLIQSIILIGKNHNLKTIAEGVESAEEWEMLREMGCDEIQGYLISKPLPPAEYEKLHRTGISKLFPSE